MKKIFKKINKPFLMGFVPLSAASLYLSDFSASAILSVAFGLSYLIWQVNHDARR